MKKYIKKIACICAVVLIFVFSIPFSAFAETHVCEWSTTYSSDSTSHWYACTGCSRKTGVGSHYGGTATTTQKAVCSACGTSYGSYASSSGGTSSGTTHTHSYDPVPIFDEVCHWQVCSCGATTTREAHYGGTATPTEYAVCSVCGTSYGDYASSGDSGAHTHNYTYTSKGGYHIKSCLCGDSVEQVCAFNGTDCVLCGGMRELFIYSFYSHSGEYLGSLWSNADTRFWVHKNNDGFYSLLLVGGSVIKDNGKYYNPTYPNMLKFDFVPYGITKGLVNYPSTDNMTWICREQEYYRAYGDEYKYYIYTAEDLHTHTYDPVPIFDESCHWQVCSCGATTTREAHYGGTATTTEKARCSYCYAEYGSYLVEEHQHNYDPVFVYDDIAHWQECPCGAMTNYNNHIDNDANNNCDVCRANIHNHYYTYKFDDTFHWGSCSCGAELSRAEHSGGFATCMHGEICQTCEFEYGTKDINNHVDFDNDKICDECGLKSADYNDNEEQYNVYDLISALAKAPSQLIQSMLDFDIFGVNVANFVKSLFTVVLVAFVVGILARYVI